MGNRCDPVRSGNEFWTGPPNRRTNHVPNEHSIDSLLSSYDLRAQPRVYSRPSVEPGVSTRIGTYAPNHELLCVRRAVEDVCVVPVQTSLKFYSSNAATIHCHNVIVSISPTNGRPFLNEPIILHVVEHITAKFAFLAHSRRKLTSDPFDRASK